MASCSVTIQNPSAGPFSLAAIFSAENPFGVILKPLNPRPAAQRPSMIVIQADNGAGENIYVGGPDMDNNIPDPSGGIVVYPTTNNSGTLTLTGPGLLLNQIYINGPEGAAANILVVGLA